MKTSVNTRREHAFVVRLADLQKLWKLLEDRIGTVKTSLKCSDDIEREFDDLEELISYDNSPAKEAIELSIKSRTKDWQKSATIDFSHKEWSGSSIHIQIETSEQECLEVKDKIFDVLDGTKPWYSFLARADSFRLFEFLLLTSLVVSGYFSLSRLLGMSVTSKEIALGNFIHLFNLMVVLGIIGGAIMIFTAKRLNKLRSWIFPVSCFAFGQGEQRYETKEKARWGIIIAFLVSLAASMVGLLR